MNSRKGPDAVAAPTLAEQLEAVENAIYALVTGAKSYSIANRTVTRENLSELRAWRDDLKQEIGASSGPARNYVTFARMT